MSSDFNLTVASWFLGNVHVKPISTHSVPGPFSQIFRISVSPLVGLWWCTLNEFFVENEAYFLITDTKFEEKQLSKWLVVITILKFFTRSILFCLKRTHWSYHLENFEFWNNHSKLWILVNSISFSFLFLYEIYFIMFWKTT